MESRQTDDGKWKGGCSSGQCIRAHKPGHRIFLAGLSIWFSSAIERLDLHFFVATVPSILLLSARRESFHRSDDQSAVYLTEIILFHSYLMLVTSLSHVFIATYSLVAQS